jgi:hypothetical protein
MSRVRRSVAAALFGLGLVMGALFGSQFAIEETKDRAKLEAEISAALKMAREQDEGRCLDVQAVRTQGRLVFVDCACVIARGDGRTYTFYDSLESPKE